MQAEAAALVAGRSPGSGRAGRWTGRPRPRCSPRSRPDGAEAVAGRARSCWPRGPRPRSAPDIHAQVGKVLYSVPWRLIGKTADARVTATMVQFFISGQLVKTHAAQGAGQADRLRRLPAGEDRVPRCAPRPGAASQAAGDRPGVRAGHRRAAGRQRAVPAARRPGRARPGRPARPGPAGSRLRQGDRGRRPVLPDHQGHPRRRAPSRPAARRPPGTAAPRRSCTARPPFANVIAHARHHHQRCRAPLHRRGRPGHDHPGRQRGPAGRPRPPDPRRRGPARAGRHPGPGGLARTGRDRDPGSRALR